MEFALDLVPFILGAALVAICLLAIPGPPREGEEAPAPHGHGGH